MAVPTLFVMVSMVADCLSLTLALSLDCVSSDCRPGGALHTLVSSAIISTRKARLIKTHTVQEEKEVHEVLLLRSAGEQNSFNIFSCLGTEPRPA